MKEINIKIGNIVDLTVTETIAKNSLTAFDQLPVGLEKRTNFNTGEKTPIYFFLAEAIGDIGRIDQVWLKTKLTEALRAAFNELAADAGVNMQADDSANRVAKNIIGILTKRAKGGYDNSSVKMVNPVKQLADGDLVAEISVVASSHIIPISVYLGGCAHVPALVAPGVANAVGQLLGDDFKGLLEEVRRGGYTIPFKYGDLELSARFLFPFEEISDWISDEALAEYVRESIAEAVNRMGSLFGVR